MGDGHQHPGFEPPVVVFEEREEGVLKSVQEILGPQEGGHPNDEPSAGGDDLIVFILFIILVGVLGGMDPRV